MKKLLSLTVLGLSLFTLAACGKSSSKTETKGSLDNEASKILTVKHGNVRQNFDKITMANASQEFSGGSNLDSLKGWFGEPSSTSQEQAGDAKLDVYNWQYDNVVVTAKLFNNSTVVKSISNFSYVRDPKITLKMYENLKNGTSYDDAVKTLGTPDVYSIAVSSDATMTQALWSSNLVAKKGETGSLTLNFKMVPWKTSHKQI